MREARLLLCLGCAFVVVSCGGAPVDLATSIELTEVTTGWHDAGLVEGDKNRLVPMVGFRLKNVAEAPVKHLQLNAVFRRAGEDNEWGSSYLHVIGGDGLAPGGATDPVVLRSNLGYTSTEPRVTMLGHSQFRDVHVRVFAKQGGASWMPLGEWDVEREMRREPLEP